MRGSHRGLRHHADDRDLAARRASRSRSTAFIGSSPIRQLAEDWDLDTIVKRSAEAIDVAVKAGLPVAYVTEDTTRSRPDMLATLFKMAIDHGASRLCLCDTVGHATPDGVRNLISFTKAIIAGTGRRRSASTGTATTIAGSRWRTRSGRSSSGADRVHGTALGIGERVGNAPMELILLNLKLLGLLEDQDLTHLLEYCNTAARGASAGRSRSTTRSSAATRSARRPACTRRRSSRRKEKGDAWLADRIYSGVPAGMFGRQQEICIGYMSGASNVNFWLRQRRIEPSKELVEAILKKAKGSSHILSDEEILAVVDEMKGR